MTTVTVSAHDRIEYLLSTYMCVGIRQTLALSALHEITIGKGGKGEHGEGGTGAGCIAICEQICPVDIQFRVRYFCKPVWLPPQYCFRVFAVYLVDMSICRLSTTVYQCGA